MSTFLKELAEGLREVGFAVSPIEEPKGLTIVWPHPSGIGSQIVHYYGRGEDPILYNALLDVLEKAGLRIWVDSWNGHRVNAFEQKPPYRVFDGQGATRTEAIANAFLSAWRGGLLKGVER